MSACTETVKNYELLMNSLMLIRLMRFPNPLDISSSESMANTKNLVKTKHHESHTSLSEFYANLHI